MRRMAAAIASLLAVAAAATYVWRLEVLLHPQGIFEIVEYAHWSIPFDMGIFLWWVGVFAPVPNRSRRTGLIITAIGFMGVWYPLAKASIINHHACYLALASSIDRIFNLFGASMPFLWAVALDVYPIYILVVLTPLMFAALLWCFGARPSWWQVLLSLVIYVAAWPGSIRALDLVMKHHDHDLVEAFRVGTIIPFLVIGLGVLALPRRRRQTNMPAPHDAAS